MALNTTHVFGNMEEFDPERGDNWLMYTKQMEQYFATDGTEGEEKKRAVFGSKAYGLLQNLLALAKPAETAFIMLTKTMKDHFPNLS